MASKQDVELPQSVISSQDVVMALQLSCYFMPSLYTSILYCIMSLRDLIYALGHYSFHLPVQRDPGDKNASKIHCPPTFLVIRSLNCAAEYPNLKNGLVYQTCAGNLTSAEFGFHSFYTFNVFLEISAITWSDCIYSVAFLLVYCRPLAWLLPWFV